MLNRIRLARHGFDVRRWHTCPMRCEQTVADHTARMMQILVVVWPDVSREALIAALHHDVGEFWTGDIPSPVKKRLDENMSEKMHSVEAEFVREVFTFDLEELAPEDQERIAFADLMELLLTCLDELNRGDHNAFYVLRVGLNYLKGMKIIEQDPAASALAKEFSYYIMMRQKRSVEIQDHHIHTGPVDIQVLREYLGRKYDRA